MPTGQATTGTCLRISFPCYEFQSSTSLDCPRLAGYEPSVSGLMHQISCGVRAHIQSPWCVLVVWTETNFRRWAQCSQLQPQPLLELAPCTLLGQNTYQCVFFGLRSGCHLFIRHVQSLFTTESSHTRRSTQVVAFGKYKLQIHPSVFCPIRSIFLIGRFEPGNDVILVSASAVPEPARNPAN